MGCLRRVVCVGLRVVVSPLQGFEMGFRPVQPRPLAWALFDRPFGAQQSPGRLAMAELRQDGGGKLSENRYLLTLRSLALLRLTPEKMGSTALDSLAKPQPTPSY